MYYKMMNASKSEDIDVSPKFKFWVYHTFRLRPPSPSKFDLSLGTSERAEIYSICWGCSEEAVVKFSAR